MEADKKSQRQKNLVIISIILFVIISISIIVVFIINQQSHVTITNLDEVNSNSTISSSDQKRLEDRLWLVLKNSTYFNNTNVEDIYIRPDSYREETFDDITNISFLVDIDSQKVTYLVEFSTSKNSPEYFEDVLVNCPKYNETKYPETTCYGMNGNTSDITLNLPYSSDIDGHNFTVSIRYDFYDEPTLEITIPDICSDYNLAEKAEEKVSNWIKDDLYLNPDDYILYVPTYNCD